MPKVSFSLSEEEHSAFVAEARCKGLTVSQYCKMAAFSHLAKYASKGIITEVAALLEAKKHA